MFHSLESVVEWLDVCVLPHLFPGCASSAAYRSCFCRLLSVLRPSFKSPVMLRLGQAAASLRRLFHRPLAAAAAAIVPASLFICGSVRERERERERERLLYCFIFLFLHAHGWTFIHSFPTTQCITSTRIATADTLVYSTFFFLRFFLQIAKHVSQRFFNCSFWCYASSCGSGCSAR